MLPLFVFYGLTYFYDQAHEFGEKRDVGLSVSGNSETPSLQKDNEISRGPANMEWFMEVL
jgi:hypothetical protein